MKERMTKSEAEKLLSGRSIIVASTNSLISKMRMIEDYKIDIRHHDIEEDVEQVGVAWRRMNKLRPPSKTHLDRKTVRYMDDLVDELTLYTRDLSAMDTDSVIDVCEEIQGVPLNSMTDVIIDKMLG